MTSTTLPLCPQDNIASTHWLDQKKVLFPEIDWAKKNLRLTRLHSQMCIRIYNFCFKKLTEKQTNTQTKVKRN